MDARLLEGVGRVGKEWVGVAAYVSEGSGCPTVDKNQCRKRYNRNLDPAINDLNDGPWTEAEFERLKRMVGQQQTSSRWNGQIDWKPIAKKLNRSPRMCQDKWAYHQRSLRSKKTGPFSPEEDETIRARVAAWDTSKRGLWSGLEGELGRGEDAVWKRW
ncbi:hypothetical protein B484DRAFT_441581, partial [Ochromonadaceae sp. CCMP2298]